jgi:hypothetical protein
MVLFPYVFELLTPLISGIGLFVTVDERKLQNFLPPVIFNLQVLIPELMVNCQKLMYSFDLLPMMDVIYSVFIVINYLTKLLL